MYNTNDLVSLRQRPLSEYSNKALLLATRLTRLVRDSGGNKLSMQDPELTDKLFGAVENDEDPKLQSMVSQLVSELQDFDDGNT